MSVFEQEKQQYIETLKEQGNLIGQIVEENGRVNLLDHNEMAELEKIRATNKHLLHKLESGEFEIAIVGLEKAGKSTFSNALIENDILPHASERCTFTSTRLTSGSDKAVAEFYSKAEFNAILQGLLAEIEYPNAENATVESLGLNEFRNFFEGLASSNPHLHKIHFGTTFKEIEDILLYQKGLRLDGKTQEFSGKELESAEFKEFITGKKTADGTDTSKPRSIKSLEIESSKLDKMPSAIIYDVPGFDSPTRIHRRQTEERLKSADAIILVTNVGTQPSIQGTSLDVLHAMDDDGIALKDKLFVFGNQLDRANSEKDVKNNPETLRNDVKKHNIGRIERVFVGSAKKHLVEKGLLADKEDAKGYHDKYDIPANIDTIFDALTRYYETERFDNLKTKISKNRIALTALFSKIVESHKESDMPINEGSELANIIREKQREISKRLEKALAKFLETARKTILEDKVLTDRFKDEIDKEHYFEPISQAQFDEVKTKHTRTTNKADLPLNKINAELRKSLYERVLADNEKIIGQVTVDEDKKWYSQMQNDFVQAVQINKFSAEQQAQVEKLTETLFEEITGGVAQNTEKFSHLINRFARNVFDVLIEHPLFDKDRNALYDNRKAEFTYLDNYYNNGKGSNGKLVSMILSQTQRDMITEVRSEFNTNRGIILKELSSAGINVLLKTNPVLNTAITAVNTVLSSDLLSVGNISADKVIEDNTTSHKTYTEQGVIDEINTDLINLKDVLRSAVVEAVQLDYAFFTSLDIQVKLLLDALNPHAHSTENQAKLDKYIGSITDMIIEPIQRDIAERVAIRELEQQFLAGMKQHIAA